MDSWFLLSFPAQVIFGVAGLEEAKKPSGEKVLRLIQIPFDVRLLYGTGAICVKSCVA